MSVIATLLDKLALERSGLAGIEAEIEQYIPESLRKARAAVQAEIACLEKEIKDKAKYVPESQAHTLVGHHLQLVWNPEAEISYTRKAYWSIKARGQK